MTDKVQKIREEVERLYNQSLADENRQADRGLERAANVSCGKSKACKELLSFIDSLQEESVSNSDWLTELQEKLDNATPEQLEELWNKYNGVDEEEPVSNPIDFEQELYKAFGQVKDFTFGMRIAKWFYDMGKNSQEPVSEELNTVAKEYANNITDKIGYRLQLRRAVCFGANWQKEQMMAKAKSGTVQKDNQVILDNGTYIDLDPSMQLKPSFVGLKEGDRIKVIVIKED